MEDNGQRRNPKSLTNFAEMPKLPPSKYCEEIRKTALAGKVIAIIAACVCVAVNVYAKMTTAYLLGEHKAFAIFAVIFTFVGVMLIIGASTDVPEKAKKCTREASGYIASVERSLSGDSEHGSSVSYTPTFKYTFNGVDYELKAEKPAQEKPSTGDPVCMLVDPANPQDAFEPKDALKSMKSSYTIGIVCMIVGAILFLIAHS